MPTGFLPPVTSSPEDVQEAPLLTWMLRVLRVEKVVDVALLPGTPKGPEEWERVVKLARHNVVTVRLGSKLLEAGAESMGVDLAAPLLEERKRQERMTDLLIRIAQALKAEGLENCLIKTPDHRPDMGHDLDFLVPLGSAGRVGAICRTLGGEPKEQSVCDRLAGKISYAFADGTTEWHLGLLGQMGEDRWWPQQILLNSQKWEEVDTSIAIPAPEHRFLLQVQQRLYRHFFLRLGDVINSISLIKSGTLDWEALRQTALLNGIWGGCLTYLGYLKSIHEVALGRPLDVELPSGEAPGDGRDELGYCRSFIRFPRFRVVTRLYREKASALLGYRQWENLGRISLLPLLAAGELFSLKVLRRSVFW